MIHVVQDNYVQDYHSDVLTCIDGSIVVHMIYSLAFVLHHSAAPINFAMALVNNPAYYAGYMYLLCPTLQSHPIARINYILFIRNNFEGRTSLP